MEIAQMKLRRIRLKPDLDKSIWIFYRGDENENENNGRDDKIIRFLSVNSNDTFI